MFRSMLSTAVIGKRMAISTHISKNDQNGGDNHLLMLQAVHEMNRPFVGVRAEEGATRRHRTLEMEC